MMNQSYNVEHNNKYNLSLQTDPDLYALKNKKKSNSYKAETTTVSVSNNRLAYVEALVDINAVVIETIWCNHSVIREESRVSPVVPLRTFIQEVLKRSRTTYSTLQTALFYLFRCKSTMMNHLQQNNAYISCGRRMFLASLIVASKFVQDKTYRNSAWAKIAGLPVQEINTAERYFLDILDYRLYIEQSIFDRWHKLLHIRTQARIHNIPTTIHDLSCLSFTPKYHHHHNYPIIQQCTTSSYSNINTLINTTTNITNNYIHSPTYSLPPPSLSSSHPSSISSSPAQTPTQISPVRLQQKRKHEDSDRDHISLLDRKHCRLW